MPESKTYFKCQNQKCEFKTDDVLVAFESDEKLEEYDCPACDQSYLINKNGEIHKVFNQLVIESSDDYINFTDKHAFSRIYINELVLKNIDYRDIGRKGIELKRCVISSLIIENLNLWYGSHLTFVDCIIERLYISDSTFQLLRHIGFYQKTQVIFGINIIRCCISNEFEISEVNSDICISDSVVESTIRVKKSSIYDFGLFHNEVAIAIESDDSSVVHSRTSKLISDLPKEDIPDLTSAKTIRGVEIQELHITQDIKGEIKLEGVHIKKLIFQYDSEVYARINFEDCQIDEILNYLTDFKEDVQFYNCTFNTNVEFRRCTFQGSFIAEACTFKEYLILDEITVQNNIRLNYSLFEKGIKMTESRFLASVYMSLVRGKGFVYFGNLLIHKDLVVYADLFEQIYEMEYCNVRGAVILSMTDFEEEASLYDVRAKNLEFKLSKFNKDTNLISTKIEEISVSNSVFLGGVRLTKITGNNVLRVNGSLFYGVWDVWNCEMVKYDLIANSFYDSILHYNTSVKRSTYLENNVVAGDAEFDDCEVDEFHVIRNTFLKEIKFNRLEVENLQVTDNTANDLIIGSGIYNELGLYGNSIKSNSKIYRIICNNDTFLTGNKFEGIVNSIVSCKFNGSVQMIRNHFISELYINKNVAHQDFEFIDNRKDSLVEIMRNDFYSFNIEGSEFVAALLMYDNRHQAKLSIGSQAGKGSTRRVVFHNGASLFNNRIRTFNMFNVAHASAFCFMNNHLEGDFYLKECTFGEELDLSGSYIGGSMRINNIGAEQFAGNLILDDVFVDKRISLKNTSPKYVSIVDAKLNGLNIPDNWQMIWFKLKDTLNGKYILADDANKRLDPENQELSYQLLKTYCQKEDFDSISVMQNFWDDIHISVFDEEKSKKFKKKIENFDELVYYRNLISDILKMEFMIVYYGMIKKESLDAVLSLGTYFETFNTDSDDPEISEGLKNIKKFFEIFNAMCTAFRDRNLNAYRLKQLYKRNRRSNLMNQYLILRQIYAENGELGNEDKAYFKWMHYKTLLHMSSRKPFAKAISVLKLLVFETIFGWGVALWRIVMSTIATVFLFSGIYTLLFEFSPSFKMQWDGAHMPAGTIGYAKILLFSLQTTFGAFTGDWAPIGSLGIKLLMTINTVLGVLFVTFLIGAYGRKMLR